MGICPDHVILRSDVELWLSVKLWCDFQHVFRPSCSEYTSSLHRRGPLITKIGGEFISRNVCPSNMGEKGGGGGVEGVTRCKYVNGHFSYQL